MRSILATRLGYPEFGGSAYEGGRDRKSYQAHLERTPSRMVNWAEQIGPHTVGRKDGSGSGSDPADPRLPLSEREIDLEELAWTNNR